MRLPGWLDVALEGGVLQLQQALADTVALRRALRRSWRGQVLELRAKCDALWQRQEAIEAAIERARKRARVDPAARPVLKLIDRLELERRRLHADFRRLLARPGLTSDGAFIAVLNLADHLGYYESAWRKFHRERIVFGTLLGVTLGGVPFACWLDGSSFGFVPTLFDIRALRYQSGFWLGLALLLTVALVTWWRLAAWQWLGVTRGKLVVPTLVGAATMTAAGSYFLDVGLGIGFGAMAAGATLAVGCAFHAVWNPSYEALVPPMEEPSGRLEAVDPAVATEKTAGQQVAC
ncbi:MAG: hypothetical protein QM723_22915 [Myxococcaceae bacterium]